MRVRDTRTRRRRLPVICVRAGTVPLGTTHDAGPQSSHRPTLATPAVRRRIDRRRRVVVAAASIRVEHRLFSRHGLTVYLLDVDASLGTVCSCFDRVGVTASSRVLS